MHNCLAVAAAGLPLLAALLCVAEGDEPSSRAAPDTQPADEAVMKVLARLESAGTKRINVEADVDYRVDMLQTQDVETRQGKAYYRAPSGDKPAMFRIHFDTLRQGAGGAKIADPVDYVFDGEWLTVRKERIKQMIRYQVAPPGQKASALELGKGPFPVPFGQSVQAVLERFIPATRPLKEGEPAGTECLKLTVRPAAKGQIDLKWVEMWVRPDGLPVRIVAEDRSENRSTAAFANIRTPADFPAETFDLPRPPRDWEFRVEPFAGRAE